MRGLCMFLVVTGAAAFAGGCDPEEEKEAELIPVVFQSKWWPQAQFVGYYAAGGHTEKGEPSKHVPQADGKDFYAEQGLDVTVLPGNGVNPSLEVAEGRAEFGTDWIANLLLAIQENGLDLVHIMQVFQRPGFELVALSSADIDDMEDMAGQRVGVWSFGNQYPAQVCFKKHGLTSTLDQVPNPDVTTIEFAFDPALVWPNDVDAASAMVYNELDQIVGLGYPLEDLTRVSSADNNCGLLEDFIFTSAELLDDPNYENSGFTGVEIAQRFIKATLKGWKWAIAQENQAKAKAIVLDFCADLDTCQGSGSTQSADIHQTWQLQRVRELVQPGFLPDEESVEVGCLSSSAFEQTRTLLTDVDLIEAATGQNIVNKEILQGIGVNCQ